MNYILEKVAPLEAKTVSDLLHKSSAIGSALRVLEKVSHQSLVSLLRYVDWGWNSLGFYVKFSYHDTIWPERLKKKHQ